MQNADQKLIDHLLSQHKDALRPVADELSRAFGDSERVCYASAYNEAIAVAIRRGAPLASYAIDRRSLYNCCQALRDDTVETLVCFRCERRFPYRRTTVQNAIAWHDSAMQVRGDSEPGEVEYDFLGVSPKAVEEIFGLKAYLDKYGNCDDGPNLKQRLYEFDDFYLDVPFARGTVRVFGLS